MLNYLLFSSISMSLTTILIYFHFEYACYSCMCVYVFVCFLCVRVLFCWFSLTFLSMCVCVFLWLLLFWFVLYELIGSKHSNVPIDFFLYKTMHDWKIFTALLIQWTNYEAGIFDRSTFHDIAGWLVQVLMKL